MHKNIPSKICFLLLVILLGLQTCWATAPLDFDGDGKTDPVVVKYDLTETGAYQITWYIQQSRDGFFAFPWGQSSTGVEDQFVPADYDGDGKCDLAVWRRRYTEPGSQSYFFIYYSASNTVGVIPLGGSQDRPLSQDYDGDGKADPAIYSSPNWYIQQSRDGYRVERWSIETPIPGDYDGDGKADLAGTRRPSNPTPANELTFYIHLSSDGSWIVRQLGNARAHMVVPGDYDGDGKTDIAIWGGACEYGNGTWYWIRSSDGGYSQMKWGYPCTVYDSAVQGDYDGDGKTDLAVYRKGSQSGNPSTQSYFYINGSTKGFMAIPWGAERFGPIVQFY